MTLCANGLHEIAPGTPKIGPRGHEHRCHECFKAKRQRRARHVRLTGQAARHDKTYNAKRPPRVEQAANSPRKRAHNLMRKYGMTLGQAERLGVVPPDVQEALHGDR